MQPFVKWAGGKRQLLNALIQRMPKEYNTYYEPFIGGGALFFDLAPEHAVIGDVNPVLIAAYNVLKNDVDLLIIRLKQYEEEHENAVEKKAYYLEMREKFNKHLEEKDYSLTTVALFLYLNKTCFNGLFRVNSKGLFNVPFNNKEKVILYNEENLLAISKYLNNIKIMLADFEETCKDAKAGDFVFFDSPYAPLKDDSFEAYTKEGFSRDEHIRLANLFTELTNKGVKCMLTNHNTDLINDLYKEYKIEVVQVKRMINRNADKRTGEEVIVTNYEVL